MRWKKPSSAILSLSGLIARSGLVESLGLRRRGAQAVKVKVKFKFKFVAKTAITSVASRRERGTP
jgi:hypothetical protein